MPRYRLLAIDIDGTLVNTQDEISPKTARALAQASASGIRIVLTSGRRYSRVVPLARALNLDTPVVTASGALVKNPSDHATLHVSIIERPLLLDMLQVLSAQGRSAVLCADTYSQGFDFFCVRLDEPRHDLADFFAQNSDRGRVMPRLMEDPPPDIFAAFALGSEMEMRALADCLEASLPGRLHIHVLRSPRYLAFMCEIANAGVTKWSAVRRLADQWGIAPFEICAVGDDVNDIPMVQAAGLGVAMGNARAELKRVADRIAPAHLEDGLAEVVRWLLEQ